MNKNIILKLTSIICLVFALESIQAQTLSDAIRLSENEAYEKSEKAFASVITADGTNADAYYYQGQNYLKLEEQTVEYYIVTLKAIINSSSDNNKYKSKHLTNLFINTIVLVIIVLLNNII